MELIEINLQDNNKACYLPGAFAVLALHHQTTSPTNHLKNPNRRKPVKSNIQKPIQIRRKPVSPMSKNQSTPVENQ